MKQQHQSTTTMQAALLRAMVKAGIDKRPQSIKPEMMIPQSTQAHHTFHVERKNVHRSR